MLQVLVCIDIENFAFEVSNLFHVFLIVISRSGSYDELEYLLLDQKGLKDETSNETMLCLGVIDQLNR